MPRLILSLVLLLMFTLVTPDAQDAPVLTATLSGHTLPVNDLDFSDDGTLLASASDDLTARLWEVPAFTEVAVLEGQLNQVRSVDLAPDGNTLLTTGFNGIAFLWDVRSQTRASSVNDPRYPSMSDGAFAPDGETFAVALGSGQVQLYETESGEVLQTLPADTLLVERVAFHPEGTQLAAGMGFPSDETWVWDPTTGSLLFQFGEGNGTVHGVAFSPAGDVLALGGGGGGLTLWEIGPEIDDINTLHDIPQAHPGGVLDVAFHPSGGTLATAGFDGVIRLWDVETGETWLELAPPGAVRSLAAVAFGPEGRYLAAAGEATDIWVWFLES